MSRRMCIDLGSLNDHLNAEEQVDLDNALTGEHGISIALNGKYFNLNLDLAPEEPAEEASTHKFVVRSGSIEQKPLAETKRFTIKRQEEARSEGAETGSAAAEEIERKTSAENQVEGQV
jgi:hypothetical protein